MLYFISYVNISIENIHLAVFARAPFLPYLCPRVPMIDRGMFTQFCTLLEIPRPCEKEVKGGGGEKAWYFMGLMWRLKLSADQLR